MSGIDEAVQAGRDALATVAEDSPDRPALINNLGLSLRERFLQRGVMTDLDEAIQVARQSVKTASEDHPNYNSFLGNLAVQLGLKYSKTGLMADLEEAIQVTEKAIRNTSPEDPNRVGRLNNLAMLIQYKYKRTGSMDVLEQAIELMQNTIRLTALDSPDRGMYLNNLAISLGEKYRRTGNIADLEEANRVILESVSATLPDHRSLNNLAVQLQYKYTNTGALTDLDNAIKAIREAIKETSIEHTDRAMLFNNLGLLLMDRFSRLENMVDVEEATQAAREAVNATPLDHPERAGRLMNLGLQLRYRYSRTAEISDLDEAIQTGRLCIQSMPMDHLDRALALHNVGVALRDRYLRVGGMVDLEEAIQLERDAIKQTLSGHADYPALLHGLGVQLGDRYSRTKALADLDEAIKVMTDSLKATSPDHPLRPWLLNSLGMSMSDRYERTDSIYDLQGAIRYAREAIKLAPEDHANRAMLLNNLATHLGHLYSRTGTVTDLDEAIRVSQEAVERTPADHPKKAVFLATLGARLGDRFEKTRQDPDLQAAVECHRAALHQDSASAVPRIASGLELLALSAKSCNWEQAYNAAHTAIHLLNVLAPRDLENSDKQYMLSLIVCLACDGAAVALNAGKDPLAALELLELGRGVLAVSLEEMRTDVLDLKEKHPKLAERFLTLRNELSGPNHDHLSFTDDRAYSNLQIQTSRRYETSKKLDDLLLEIRDKIGFNDFLLLPDREELQSAASHGPIVVVNVSQYRCDAMLIGRTEIRNFELPKLKFEDIKEMAQYHGLGSLLVLEWLWDAVASPILDALGFSQPQLDEDWPQVWWIPTGLLSRFPLHAAGKYRQGSQTVLDRVISSYSSTVKAIIRSRRRPLPSLESSSSNQALLVAMEKTPELSDLRFATGEVNMLRDLCKSMGLEPVEPPKNKENVLSSLQNCRVFHFAGHGRSHPTDPLQSFIYLEDWKSDKLTLNDLLKITLREHSPFLAYLSACETGRIRDARFIDESIHLIRGFQLAGFRHVIGTLWAVNDEYCLDVSRATYEEIKRGGLSDASVGRGLHLATRRLRDRWLKQSGETINRSSLEEGSACQLTEEQNGHLTKADGEKLEDRRLRDLDPSDDGDSASLDWVQYVHFGV